MKKRMKVKWRVALCGAAIAAAAILSPVTGTALADPPPPAAPALDPVAQIGAYLGSKDAQEVRKSVPLILERLNSPNWNVRNNTCDRLREAWLKPLQEIKDYEDVAELCLRASNTKTRDLPALQDFQVRRLRALMAAGKTDELMPAAKGLYNVCAMGSMHDVMLLVAEAVRAAHPGDEELYNRFVQEQVQGAREQAWNPHKSKQPATRPAGSVLAAIKVPESWYRDGIEWEQGEDFWHLEGRGNLYLLADRPDEAKNMFDRAYSIAAELDLPYATESLARVIKAQDGTVGRANAFVLSLRPKVEKKP